jgi:hypothetical protein
LAGYSEKSRICSDDERKHPDHSSGGSYLLVEFDSNNFGCNVSQYFSKDISTMTPEQIFVEIQDTLVFLFGPLIKWWLAGLFAAVVLATIGWLFLELAQRSVFAGRQ